MGAPSKAPIRGRPSVYDPEYHVEQAFNLTLLRMTDEELAAVFRINVTTFYDWMKRYPEFTKAVTRGKTPSDGEVVAAFHKRATGYDVRYTKETLDGRGEVIKCEVGVTHIPPDPGACLNWLKNRQPEKWRDKTVQEVNTTGTMTGQINMYGRPEPKDET
jgi:hypothetical protein